MNSPTLKKLGLLRQHFRGQEKGQRRFPREVKDFFKANIVVVVMLRIIACMLGM